MQALSTCNPIVATVWFFSVAAVSMFSMNPILLTVSLAGAMGLSLFFPRVRRGRTYLLCGVLFAVTSLINPIFSHNGRTVLFVLNDAPITLEALVYGCLMAGAMVSVLLLFRVYSELMTEDKLLYLFGKLSPKLALLLSMGLRYVSLFTEQSRRIRETQTALGLYRENSLPDRARGGLRVFSVLVTWALENGIVTADSMTARGWGVGRRTHFSRFSFRRRDWLLLACTLLPLAVTVGVMLSGGMRFECYPSLSALHLRGWDLLGYSCFFVTVATPIFLETEDCLRWKYLRSRI